MRGADRKQDQGDDQHVIVIEIAFRLQKEAIGDEEQAQEAEEPEEKADCDRYAGKEKNIGQVDRQLGDFLDPVKELIPERESKLPAAGIKEVLPLAHGVNGNQKPDEDPHHCHGGRIDRSEQVAPGKEPAEALEPPANR